ncbi:O-antigen ligase family protein [Pontibacter liquoris]|uniref:O-antigen ligase family protein n=1 Tax=Pontibacter liquoris TaxID=2905677 RepID=UPI001FA7779B|nr:O-antigen ligase family protein [Pontibacter liquoris]
MVFNKYKMYVIAFFGAIFFTFSGYYVLLMVGNNTIGPQLSRYITIPLRVFIVLLLGICFLLVGKKKSFKQLPFLAFLTFSLLYLLRIALEMLKGTANHISNESFLLYFLSFGFLPFLILYLKEDLELDQKLYRSAMLISGALLAIFTLLFYRDLIGTVGRISLAVSRDENYISPLALSYSASLTMGISLILLLSKAKGVSKWFLLVVAGLSCVPFFLGASRGSVMALIFPFLLFIVNQKNKLKSFYLLAALVFAGAIIVILSSYFGSNIIERFTSIGDGIQSGSSSAERIVIWEIALEHFKRNPLLGFGLESPETGNYPHNIFVEVLLTTGILGFIPFVYLVIKAVLNALFIFKYVPHKAWIGLIFLECLIQNQFSGGIYTASWLWFSMAFVLAADYKVNYMQERLDYIETLDEERMVTHGR